MTQDRTPMNLLLNPPLYCRTEQDAPDTVSQASKLDPILGKKGNPYASAQCTGVNIETHGSKD